MEKLNYSVRPMIEAFDFQKFIEFNKVQKVKHGFLVITSNQLVMGYTFGYGIGSHDGAISNAIREIYNMHGFETEGNQYRTSEEVRSKFITAHFSNEIDLGVYLAFYFQNLKEISPDELALFEQFYDRYNNVIYNYSKSSGHPIVTAVLQDLDEPIVDEFGFKSCGNTITSEDLSDVLAYLKRIVSDNKKTLADENIIGQTLEGKTR